MCLNTLLFRILGFVSMSTILVSHHPEIHSRVFSWRQFAVSYTHLDVYKRQALPQVSGYTYTESDREEYIQAYSLSSNDTIRNEVNGMDQSLLSIKNKKFPSALPVLTMISSENVQNVPAWETAHRNQLDLESGNHQLYIVNGGHYIWYTNLTQVVQLIDEWRIENHF